MYICNVQRPNAVYGAYPTWNLNKEKLNPKHKDAMEYLGELYVENDRMDEAQRMLDRLDEACFLACKEYRQLKDVIENKNGAGNRYELVSRYLR